MLLAADTLLFGVELVGLAFDALLGVLEVERVVLGVLDILVRVDLWGFPVTVFSLRGIRRRWHRVLVVLGALVGIVRRLLLLLRLRTFCFPPPVRVDR